MNTVSPAIPLPTVAWTVAALLVAAAPHLAAMPLWLAMLFVLAAAWRLAAGWRGWRPPPGWLRVLITISAVALVVLAHGGLWGRRTATTLLCLMLAAKMFELFRIRDLRMVASVCFFLIATQFLFNERLVYLAYLAAGSLTAIVALMHVHRLEYLGDQHIRSEPDLRQALHSGALMLAAAVPVAITLFVLFPRLAQPLWGLPDHVMDGRTGLSDSMSPGSIANLYLDDSPAFRAEFEDTPPPPDQRYWRGPVLWHFDGDTWHQPMFTLRQEGAFVPVGPNPWRYRVQLEPHERRWLFALDYPIEAPGDAQILVDYQIISRRPITTLSQYEMVSNPDFIDMLELHPIQRRLALRLPDDRNPRARQHARELRDRFADDRQLISAVLQWFREEEFFYSLETTPTGRHGADEFLFDLRTGYCEHYASAFAVLMRAAGIPTRIVTGYQGGFWQPSGGYLLVRQSDAHAWTEVWLEGSGWTRVDPTAAVSPARINQGSRAVIDSRRWFDSEWMRNLHNRYDRVQHLWNRWILGFDAARQQRLLERFGLPQMSPASIGLIMITMMGIVVLAIALVLLKRPPDRSDPVQRAWKRLLGRLRRVGLAKRPYETPNEFIDRAVAQLGPGGEGLARLGELYCRARYGRNDLQAAAEFIRLARDFRPGQESEPERPFAV